MVINDYFYLTVNYLTINNYFVSLDKLKICQKRTFLKKSNLKLNTIYGSEDWPYNSIE